MSITAQEYRRRVCDAMNFISANLHRELSLEEIASHASFSMFHFHRIFRTVVGETVAEFTWRLRLETAANRLMTKRHEGITAIALDCGFSSPQNFARMFRRRFGTTPSAYRNRKCGNAVSNIETVSSLHTVYVADELIPHHTPTTRRIMMNATVKDLPRMTVAYVRKLGPYGQATCEQAFGELMHWAGPRGLLGKGAMLAVYWDNPEVTPPDKCRTDACLVVSADTDTAGQVAIQSVGGGPHAVCSFVVAAADIAQAWDEAFHWLVDNGHECDDRPTFELYHATPDQHPEGKWTLDICIPLKRP